VWGGVSHSPLEEGSGEGAMLRGISPAYLVGDDDDDDDNRKMNVTVHCSLSIASPSGFFSHHLEV